MEVILGGWPDGVTRFVHLRPANCSLAWRDETDPTIDA
jgi:hypothetical protein